MTRTGAGPGRRGRGSSYTGPCAIVQAAILVDTLWAVHTNDYGYAASAETERDRVEAEATCR